MRSFTTGFATSLCVAASVLGGLSGLAQAQVMPINEAFAFDAADPFMGRWLGSTTRGGNSPIDLSVFIERDGANAPFIWLDAGQWNIYNQHAWNVVIDKVVENGVEKQRLAFNLPKTPRGGVFRITGTLSEDGQEINGIMSHTPRMRQVPDVPVLLRRVPRPIDLPEQYSFTGTCQHPTEPFDVTLMLARTPGGNWVGHYDIPRNTGYNLPAYNFRITESGEFTCLIADNPAWLVEGSIDRDLKSIEGQWLRRQTQFPFRFERDELINHEIRFFNLEGSKLSGTLTYAAGRVPERGFPVAVICSTFGLQTREGEIGEHSAYKRLAEELARAGIAAFRIDDRGVGRAEGDFSTLTTADTARDLAAALIALAKTPGVDPQRIGMIGHGEGGIAAIMASGVKVKPAWIATLSMPALSGFELFTKRVELQGQIEGKEQNAILADVQFDRGLVKMLIDGRPSEQIAKAVENELMRRRAGLDPAAVAALPPVNEQRDQIVARYDTPWTRGFVGLDPEPMLVALDVPFYAAYAARDYPVPGVPNRERAMQALAAMGDKAQVRFYEGKNHWYQDAQSLSEAEYESAGVPFADPVIPDLVAWIKGVLAALPEPAQAPAASPAAGQAPAPADATPAAAPQP